MRATTREAIRNAIFEAFFVVLAVVLALAANEWRQGRAERRQARQAMASIVEELRSNREAVQESFAYHSGRLQRLRELEGEGSAPGLEEFPRGFISPAQVFQTAWDAAAETGALVHMEFATVLELSRLYARQERYERQEAVAGRIIYEELFRAGVGGVVANHANLMALIGTFSYRERQLLEFYDQTLAALGETPAEPR